MRDSGGRIRSGSRLHFAVMLLGLGGSDGRVFRNVAVGIGGGVRSRGLRLDVFAVVLAIDLGLGRSGLRG